MSPTIIGWLRSLLIEMIVRQRGMISDIWILILNVPYQIPNLFLFAPTTACSLTNC